MFNIFRAKKIHAFGIDISDSSIKVMDLISIEGRISPRVYRQVALPTGIIANNVISKPDKLAEYIKRVVESMGKLDTKYVVASVPENKSFVRTVSIPKMEHSEIDGALPYELEQDIPVPIDQVYMDWQILSETAEKINLLVTASPREYIDRVIEALKDAQLKPVAIELKSQAIARCVIGKGDSGASVLILDISKDQTNFIIVENGNISYTSSIPVAGAVFTESIARNLGVSASEADKLKQEVGLTGESKRGDVRQALLPVLDNIVDEIKNIIRFYEEHSQTRQLSRIYLCGGSARLSGLVDYIEARMNLGTRREFGQISIADIWANFPNVSKDKILPTVGLEYATAIGLALRGLNL